MRRSKESVKAARALNNNRYDEAISLYTAIGNKYGEDADLLANLARCYVGKDNLAAAAQFAEKAVKLEKTHFEMLMLLARHWHQQKDWDRVYHYTSEALNCAPVHIPAMPGWILAALRFLTKFRKFKHVDPDLNKYLSEQNEQNKSLVAWSEEFKRWYEEQSNCDGSPDREVD